MSYSPDYSRRMLSYDISDKRPLILVAGDDPRLCTGFGVILRNISHYLKESGEFRVAILGFYAPREGMSSTVIDERGIMIPNNTGIDIFPTFQTQDDVYGQVSLPKLIKALRPEVVLTVGDVWMVSHVAKWRKIAPFTWISYTPIDTSMIPEGWTSVFRSIDVPVVYGEFAKDVLLSADPSLSRKLRIIPHGVNTSLFKPRDKDTRKKTRFAMDWQGKKVVMCVARNHRRKKLTRLLDAIAMLVSPYFTCEKCGAASIVGRDVEGQCPYCGSAVEIKTKHSDLLLYLHAPLRDLGIDLRQEVRRRSLEPFVMLSPEVHIGAGVPERALSLLYAAADVFAIPTGGEGWCAVPGMSVDTPSGPVFIENVSKGDLVTSHRGHQCRVLDTTKRRYVGDVVFVKVRCRIQPLIFTPEHPHYVVKRRGARWKDVDWSPNWIPASDVEKGDFLFAPWPHLDSARTRSIRISDHIDVGEDTHSGGRLVCAMSFSDKRAVSLSNIAAAIGESPQYISRALRETCDRSEMSTRKRVVHDYCEHVGYSLPEPRWIPDCFRLTKRLAFLFGLYISEGSVSGGRVEFTLNCREGDVADELLRTMKDVWGINCHKLFRGKKIQIRFSFPFLADFFKRTCGGCATEKRIPKFLMNSTYAPHVLCGIFYGDGSFLKEKSRFSFSTASRTLAGQIRYLLASMKVLSYETYSDRQNGCWAVNIYADHAYRFSSFVRPEKYGERLKPGIRKARQSFFKECGGGCYIPIESVSTEGYGGLVYNIHVNCDESYLTQGIATHNCLPIHEAMASGLPVVATNYSAYVGQLIEDDDTGLLADVSDFDIEDSVGAMRALVDVVDLARLIDRLLSEDSEEYARRWHIQELPKGFDLGMKLRKRLGRSAVQRAGKYDWQDVGPMWPDLVSEHCRSKSSDVVLGQVRNAYESSCSRSIAMVVPNGYPCSSSLDLYHWWLARFLSEDWNVFVFSDRYRGGDMLWSRMVGKWNLNSVKVCDYSRMQQLIEACSPDVLIGCDGSIAYAASIAEQICVPLIAVAYNPRPVSPSFLEDVKYSQYIFHPGLSDRACHQLLVNNEDRAFSSAWYAADIKIAGTASTANSLRSLGFSGATVVYPFIDCGRLVPPDSVASEDFRFVLFMDCNNGVIDAVQRLSSEMEDVVFGIVSPGNTDLQKRFGLKKNVRVFTVFDDIGSRIASASAIVMTEPYEKFFPASAIEAGFCGVPFILPFQSCEFWEYIPIPSKVDQINQRFIFNWVASMLSSVHRLHERKEESRKFFQDVSPIISRRRQEFKKIVRSFMGTTRSSQEEKKNVEA